MTVWVLLLRGINVGGAGKLPMADLRRLLTDLGCDGVATYIQSGNAVFASDRSRADLSEAIAGAIEAAQGFRPPLFLLTAAELSAALDANPFPEAAADPKPMHLFFHDAGTRPDAAALDADKTGREAWSESGGVLYLRAPDGIGRSKLAVRIGRQFKGATARNLTTCRKLLAMAQAVSG
jgi:uncharacterized protein (DUF1697 family)